MILFRAEHKPLILAGTKTQTRRLWPKGCRVRLSAMGKLVARHRLESRVGTATNHGRGEGIVMVLWEGTKHPQGWHRDFVERM